MEVKILRLGTNGEGVFEISEGKDKGKIAFVDFALPDEIVDVDIVENKSKFSRAKLNRIKSISKHRVTPKCPYFESCGGCDLQHLENSYQDDFKINKVKFALKKYINNCDIDLVSNHSYHYRNKMVFPFANKDDELILGMFKKNSHEVVDINFCLLASDNINSVLKIAKNYFQKSNLKAYDEKTKSGNLKYLVVRAIDEKILVSIICKTNADMSGFYKVLSDNFKQIGLNVIISNSDKDIMSGVVYHSFGLQSLQLQEFGINYEINNFGFLQVNSEIKQSMYSEVLKNLRSENVIDAYSGAGLLSAIISKNANKVVGIEINKDASNSANLLKKNNNLNNVEFINADTKMVLNKVLSQMPNSTLVLDPPRSGCEKVVLDMINSSNNSPNRIIYISCNLATLQRDLETLSKYYKVIYIKCFDMFYACHHVETLVVLDKI